MTTDESTSFSAGQDCGTRLAACVARLAALELTCRSRWWNRRRHRLMAGALVACAEELECSVDEGGRRDEAGPRGEPLLRLVVAGEAGDRSRAGAPARRAPARG